MNKKLTANEMVMNAVEKQIKEFSSIETTFLKYDAIKEVYESALGTYKYNLDSMIKSIQSVLDDTEITEEQKQEQIDFLLEYNSRSYNDMNNLIQYKFKMEIVEQMLKLLK